ncbi:MAG: hypothetical protein HRU19_04450 [Pseudobacteriovorax sp.]|nr:hypothetical protein [Pseudobacteriovorax sp.]
MGSRVITKNARVPVIRKIFRKGDSFTCGICRTNHNSREEANNCLNHCWFQLRHHYPLLIKQRPEGSHYFRCQFCFRNYDTEKEGLDCAHRCIEYHEQRHFFEQLTNDLPIATKPKKQFRLVRIAPNITGKKPSNDINPDPEDPPVSVEGQTPEEKNDNFDLLPNEALEENNDLPKEVVDNRKHIDSYKKHWIRDGAKYKCCYCGELHYTRMDVEPCFKSHFDEEGWELKENGSIND